MSLRSKGKTLEPVLRIGKNGLNENTIKEVDLQLKKKKLIKIKFLKASLKNQNRKDLAKELAEKTGSEIIEAVGFIVVLYKKEKNK